MSSVVEADFIVVKAQEDGVKVAGLSRGGETKVIHTEELKASEVMLAQFTEDVSAIKVSGAAVIYTKHGVIQ